MDAPAAHDPERISSMNEHPVGIYLTSVVMIVASFLSWGSFEGALTFDSPAAEAMMRDSGFTAPTMTFELSGWNGYVNLGPIKFPNWLVVVVAVAVALLAFSRAAGIWPAPKALMVVLAAYSIGHVGFLSFMMLLNGSVGLGALVTLVGGFALLTMTLRLGRPGAQSAC